MGSQAFAFAPAKRHIGCCNQHRTSPGLRLRSSIRVLASPNDMSSRRLTFNRSRTRRGGSTFYTLVMAKILELSNGIFIPGMSETAGASAFPKWSRVHAGTRIPRILRNRMIFVAAAASLVTQARVRGESSTLDLSASQAASPTSKLAFLSRDQRINRNSSRMVIRYA